jgi:hypothetical protein
LVVAAGLGLLAFVAGHGPAAADCGGPFLTVTPERATPGEVVTVRGEGFGTDCNDTGRAMPPLGAPAANIEIFLAQDARVTRVAHFDADPRYRFEVRVRLPDDLRPGPAGFRTTRESRWGPFVVLEIAPASAPDRRPATGSCGTEPGDQSAWPGWVPVVTVGGLLSVGVVSVALGRRSALD